MKYSYVCVLSTDSYFDGLLVLYENLKDIKSKYDFLCLVTENISDNNINIMEKLGIKYKKIKTIKHNQGIGYWKYTFDKLQIFSLIEYDKLVFLDLDMLILDNIDELFNYEAPAMCLDLPFHDDNFNSGVMVIKPDKDLYDDMIKKFMNSREQYNGDQIFLNEYFGNEYTILPSKYNVMRSLYFDEELPFLDSLVVRGVIRYNKPEPEDIKIVHYIRALKPFMTDKPFAGEEYNIYKKYMDIIKEEKDNFNN